MKQIIFNESNLKSDEIDRNVKKVRAILINKEGKALVTKCAGKYMLPGGKIDGNETEVEALRREILEETGIEINTDSIQPFLQINAYNRNYYDRHTMKNINRHTQTTFFEIYTDEQINENKQRLTESEKSAKLKSEFKNLSIIQYLVETNNIQSQNKEVFDREILTALREFARYKQNSRQEIERK